MGSINVGRVVIGGLAAGVALNIGDFVINNVLLKSMFDAAMQARNIAPESLMSGSVIGQFVALDFVMAILLVFTYAAIRPRFGAGATTAVVASLLTAATTSTLAGYFTAMGFFTWGVWLPATVASTVNFLIVGDVGAMLYKE